MQTTSSNKNRTDNLLSVNMEKRSVNLFKGKKIKRQCCFYGDHGKLFVHPLSYFIKAT